MQNTMGDVQLLQRMREYSDLQKVLRKKMADGTSTPEEAEQELYLRDDLSAMRQQLGISLTPRHGDMYASCRETK